MTNFIPHETPARDAAMLPVPVPAALIGRDAILTKVYGQLKQNQTAYVYGAAGMGKTALAAKLATTYVQSGVVWLSFGTLTRLEPILVRIGRAYQVSEITNTDNPLAMIGAVAATLAQHKPLIVLEGQIDPRIVADFVARCASGLPVIVLSDSAPDVPDAVELTALDAPSALALYKQLTADTDNASIGQVVAALAMHPFAVAVVAGTARVAKQPAAVMLKALQSLPAGNPVFNALGVSFRLLNPPALQGLLLTLGSAFHGEASAEMLSIMSKAPQETIVQAMNILTVHNLVERTMRYGTPYFRLHPLVHSFAQQSLKASGKLDSLNTAYAEAVLAYAKKYSATDATSHDKLATEMDAFLAVAAWAANSGDRQTANQLLLLLTQAGNFVSARGYVYEVLQLRSLATGMNQAFPAYASTPAAAPVAPAAPPPAPEDLMDDEDDEPDEDLIEDSQTVAPPPIDLATASIESLRGALLQARQDGDKKLQLTLLKAIGKKQAEQHLLRDAIFTYSEVLMAYEAQGNDEGTLEILDTLSVLMVNDKDLQAAVLHASRGIKLADQLKDQDTKMHVLITLGDARQQLGESSDAMHAYSQALEIARKNDSEQHEALILYKLGFAQLDEGEPNDALQTWNDALRLFRAQKRREYEAKTLGGIGTAHGELGRWSEALNFHSSALHLAREVKDREEEALQLNNLAYAAIQANQLGQAVLRYRQALHLAYVSEDKEAIIATLIDLAKLLVESKRHHAIVELLADDALRLENTLREAKALKDRVAADRDPNVPLAPLGGTARDYAANAYKLLDE